MIHESAQIYPNAIIEDGVVIEEGVTVFPGAYVGKPPKVTGIVQNKPRFTRETIIRSGCVLGANSVVYAGVQIGPNTLIGDGVTVRENGTIGSECVIGNNSTLQNNVEIGNRVRVVDLSHITAYVTIEDDVFWSVGVASMNDNSMAQGGDLEPPYVEKGAMIGGGALLLPGVRIGSKAIVGSGSVVTKDVRPGDKVMGIPATNRYAAEVKAKDQLIKEYFGLDEDWDWPPRPYDNWPVG